MIIKKMRYVRYLFLFIYFYFIAPILVAQSQYPQNYFTAPIKIPLFLAGNFAEIRSNHFHGGIDIKTEGVEGKKIVAAADGYVSRIKISHGGYGRALYITHPNGYTTVYAHLQTYKGAIQKYVEDAQYFKESYTIELFPKKNELQVKQNELVALSGNSGGSGGPHLHFEIRTTKEEVPVNPLLFGFDIKDTIPPVIKHLMVYPLGIKSNVNGKNKAKEFPLLRNKKGEYFTKHKINVNGKIGFGIGVLDKLNGSKNRCGVFSIKLVVDNENVYCHSVEKVGFYETRYINSHVDFMNWKKNKIIIQKSFVAPNNKLDFYNCLNPQKGVVSFTDSLEHLLIYEIKDAYGNTTILNFKVQSSKKTIEPKAIKRDTTKHYYVFDYEQSNSIITEDLKVKLPPNILYNSMVFSYWKTKPIKNAITPTYHIHDIFTPLHSYMDLSIKIDSLSPVLESKLTVVALNDKNEFMAAENGTYKEGFMNIKTRSLGAYTVMIDSVLPVIKGYNIVEGRNMSSKKSLAMIIRDDLSGIKLYRGEIDGKWILMRYNYKNGRLTYFFDKNRLQHGKHIFTLTVEDNRGNGTAKSLNFSW